MAAGSKQVVRRGKNLDGEAKEVFLNWMQFAAPYRLWVERLSTLVPTRGDTLGEEADVRLTRTSVGSNRHE